MNKIFTKFVSLLTVTVLALVMSGVTFAQDESTWERIKRTDELRFAVFTHALYSVKEPGSDDWNGALVEMARDVATELKVDLKLVEVGGWSELVLAITAGKVDFAAGMQARPVRATAIDFAGPIYWIEWVTLNNTKFEGKNWEDYNNPDVKVAVMTGSSDQILLEKWAPKPRAALSGYFGIRSEFDPRFKNFLNWWAEWKNKLGHNERPMKDGMTAFSGIADIPESVTFTE